MSCEEVKKAYGVFFGDVGKVHKLREREKQEQERNSRKRMASTLIGSLDVVLVCVILISFLGSVPLIFGTLFLLAGSTNAGEFLLAGSTNAGELVRLGLLSGAIFAVSYILLKLRVAEKIAERMEFHCTYVELERVRELTSLVESILEKAFEKCLCKLNLPESTDEFMEERVRVVSVSRGELIIDEDLSCENNIAINVNLSSMYNLKEFAEKGNVELMFKSRHTDAFKTVFSDSEIVIHQIMIEDQMYIFICTDYSLKCQAYVFLKQEKDGTFADVVSDYSS